MKTFGIIQVKRQAPCVNADVKAETLQSCWGTLNQHFAQLLICVRDSLFSKDWSRYTPHEKTCNSDIMYVFGAMMHGTEVEYEYILAISFTLPVLTRVLKK